jgi:glutamate synthase domain-containing protein 3
MADAKYSEWTISTLKEHMLALMEEQDKRNGQRFDAQESANTLALNAAKEAVTKAEVANEKRFDNTNEWRQAMNDRDSRLIPRAEAEIKFDSITGQLNRVEKLVYIGLGMAMLAGYGIGWIVKH